MLINFEIFQVLVLACVLNANGFGHHKNCISFKLYILKYYVQVHLNAKHRLRMQSSRILFAGKAELQVEHAVLKGMKTALFIGMSMALPVAP